MSEDLRKYSEVLYLEDLSAGPAGVSGPLGESLPNTIGRLGISPSVVGDRRLEGWDSGSKEEETRKIRGPPIDSNEVVGCDYTVVLSSFDGGLDRTTTIIRVTRWDPRRRKTGSQRSGYCTIPA